MTKIGFRIRSSEKYASIYVYFHNSENQKIERRTGFIPALNIGLSITKDLVLQQAVIE